MGELKSRTLLLLLAMLLLLLLAMQWNMDHLHIDSRRSWAGLRYCIEIEDKAAESSDSSGLLGVPQCKSKTEAPWSRIELLFALKDFLTVYQSRPLKQYYQMGLDNSFGLWFLARKIQPEIIIESGGHRGHSTWILRQAVPNATIVVLGPEHPHYSYSKLRYLAKDNEFIGVDWDRVLDRAIHKSRRILVVFDDRNNQFKRVLQAKSFGFKHLVFTHNFDTGTGDAYSLRQVCDQPSTGGGHNCSSDSQEAALRSRRRKSWDKTLDISELCGKNGAWWGVRGQMRDKPDRASVYITLRDHAQNYNNLDSMLETYWELPPLTSPRLSRQRSYDPARAPPPLLGDKDTVGFQRLGLDQLDLWQFADSSQPVYVHLAQGR